MTTTPIDCGDEPSRKSKKMADLPANGDYPSSDPRYWYAYGVPSPYADHQRMLTAGDVIQSNLQASADNTLATARRMALNRQIDPYSRLVDDFADPPRCCNMTCLQPTSRSRRGFSLLVQRRKEEGKYPLEMPESIYTAVIVGWLNVRVSKKVPVETHAFFVAAVMYGPLVLAFVISCTVQASLAGFLLSTVGDAGDDLAATCDGTSGPLRMVAIFIYLCTIVREIFETRDMHRWLAKFRTSPKHEFLRVYRSCDPNEPDYPICLPASGITVAARFYFYLGVLLPKLLLSLLVLFAGCGVVLRSTNDFNLVLNSVAVAFVLDIDELCFAALVAPTVKQRCIAPRFADAAPADEQERPSGCGGYNRAEVAAFLHTYVVLAVVLGVCAAMNSYWCGASPLAALDALAGLAVAPLSAQEQLPVLLALSAACFVLLSAAFCLCAPADGHPDEDEEEDRLEEGRHRREWHGLAARAGSHTAWAQ